MSRPNFKCPVNALQKIDRFYSKYLLIVFSSYFISNCPSMRARRYNFFKFYLNQLILICFNLNLIQAAEEMRSVDESIGSGKLYFTGTGYTVNLIPHAIVLGLLALGEPPPPVLLLLPLLLLLLISNDVISLSESRGGKTIALATGANSGTERKTFQNPPFPSPLVLIMLTMLSLCSMYQHCYLESADSHSRRIESNIGQG